MNALADTGARCSGAWAIALCIAIPEPSHAGGVCESVFDLDQTFVVHREDLGVPGGVAGSGSGSKIYVSDKRWNRVAILEWNGELNEALGELGSAPAEFYEPGAIASDDSGRVFVSDVGNRRVQMFSSSHDLLGVFPIEHYAHDMTIAPDGSIVYLPADHRRSRALLIGVATASGRTVELGSRFDPDHDAEDHVIDALNRIRIDASPTGVLAIAFQTLAFVRLMSPSGAIVADFDVRGEAFDACREHWFSRHEERLRHEGRAYIQNPSRSDLVADIEAICSDGGAHGVELLADVAITDDEVLVLSCGKVYVFDLEGTQCGTKALGSAGERRLMCYELDVIDGRVFAWDPFHERRVYRFDNDR